MQSQKAKSRKEEMISRDVMHRVSTIVGVFLLFLLCLSFTDLSAQIKPFEDYSKCMTGFLNEKGDTVFPAQFESIDFLRFKYSSYQAQSAGYVVNLNGKYGLLDFKGKYLLEPAYEQIREDYSFNQAIVKLNGKYGSLSPTLEPIFPIEYDSIYSDPNDYYRKNDSLVYVIKNGKLGICSLDGNSIIPPLFDNVLIMTYDHDNDKKQNRLYLCRKGNKETIYDRTGVKIIDRSYQTMSPIFGVLDEEIPGLYSVRNHFGYYSILDSSGNKKVPWSRYGYIVNDVMDDWLYLRNTHFFKQNNNRKRVSRMTNIETGERSKWYREANFLLYHVWVKTNSYSQLLNQHFEPVSKRYLPNENIHPFTISGTAATNRNADFGHPNNLVEQNELTRRTLGTTITEQHVYAFSRTFYDPVYYYNIRRWGSNSRVYFGLINLKTQELSPVIYGGILRIGGGGKHFFWAFQQMGDEFRWQQEIPVDVYDSEGHFLRAICIDKYLYSGLSNEASRSFYQKAPRLIEGGNSFGQAKGLTYDYYYQDGTQPRIHSFDQKIANYWFFKDSTIYMQTGSAAENNLVLQNISDKKSAKDDKFLNVKYSEIFRYSSPTTWNTTVTLLTVGNTSVFVNDEFEIVLDSCSRIIKNSNYPRTYVTAIRNGKVYAFTDSVFVLVDSTRFPKGHKNDMWPIGESQFADKFGNHIDGSTIFDFNTTRIKLHKGTLVLTNKNTNDTIVAIPNISASRFGHLGALEVTTTSGKVGYVDYNNGKWIVQPMYDSLCVIHNGYNTEDKMLFARENGKGWCVIELNGTRVSNEYFDEPFAFHYRHAYTFAQRNGKVGTVDRKFQWVTKPIYESGNLFMGIGMLFTADDYVFVSGSTGKIFSVEHDSILIREQRVAFFHKGSMEIRNDHGEVLMPMKSFKDVIRNENLALTIVPHSGQGFDSTTYNLRSLNDSIPVIRRRANELVFDNLRYECISKDSMLLKYRDALWLNRTPRYCGHNIYVFSRNLAIEEYHGHCYTFENDPCEYAYSLRKLVSYFVRKDSLIEIKNLSQVLKVGYDSQLDAILEKAIQQNQTFGLACVNIPESLKLLKQNFVIRPDGIEFLLCDSYNELFIPIEELKELLLNPEAFK